MRTALGCTLLALASAELPAGYPSVPMRDIAGITPMPLVGFGTWQYNSSVSEKAVKQAFDLGYRHVDTALVYNNHAGVGAALKSTHLDRQAYFVTSKIPGGSNASATAAALEQCLSELQLDYVDLMLLHWPGKGDTSLQEQWLALEAWAKQGKARAVGVSHYCKTDLAAILEVATLPVAINQNQYHVGMGHDTQPRLHDKAYAESQGVLYEAYSTLCGPCAPPQNMELITGELVTSIGKQYNKTGAQVALRWAIQQGIPVIPKTTNPVHMVDNLDLFSFKLSQDEMHRLSSSTSPSETGTKQAPDDAQDCSTEEPHEFLV